jgi:hypothetical protein
MAMECSRARDINFLLKRNILVKGAAGPRSTSYSLAHIEEGVTGE